MTDYLKSNTNLMQLEDLGIFELRELAREIGVHLPTTMRKSELIAQIRDIAQGNMQPFISNTKKGRPPKSYSGLKNSSKENEIEETRDVVYDYRNWGKFDGEYLFNVRDMANSLSDNDSADFSERNYDFVEYCDGIAYIHEGGFGRLHEGKITDIGKKRVFKITSACTNRFNIKTGDSIVGRVGQSLKDNDFWLFDVRMINGQNVSVDDETIRKDYNKANAISVDKQIELTDPYFKFTKALCPIGYGQRILVSVSNLWSKTHFMHKLAGQFADNMKTFYIALDEQPENKFVLDSLNFNSVFCSFELEKEKQLYILEMTIEKVKRCAEIGENVTIIIDDIAVVKDLYFRYYRTKMCYSESYATEQTNTMIKTILSTGKNVKDMGNITIVVGLENANNTIQNEIRRLFGCVITIKDSNDFSPLNFDLNNTYSLNVDKILGQNASLSNELRNKCINKNNIEIDKIL